MTVLEEIEGQFSLPIKFLDKGLYSINEQMAEDLELQTHKKTLYSNIFNSKTNIGKTVLPLWSKHYTDNVDFLKDTKTILKTHKNNGFLIEKRKHLVDNFMDSTWDELQNDYDFRSKYLYLDWDFLEFFNKYALFLQLFSIYNIASPIFSLVVPIFMLFLPFIFLRMRGKSITFDSYYNILKEVLSNHSLGQLFNNFSEMPWQKRIYSLTSLFFYFFNIYQNILVCLRFKINMAQIHDYFDDIRNYIDYTQKRITHFCQNRKNLKKTYVKFIDKQLEAKDTLMLYYQKLKTITPFSYSLTKFKEIGQIMLYFYNFHTDTTLKNVFLQSFGFHGYLDNVEGLQNHIKERKISFCRFNKKKKTKFLQQYHPALMNKEPIKNDVNVDKNMIVTGPNAAGKTTLIKSTIINLILSQQFGCGFYKTANVHPYQYIHCYLNIPDTSGRDSLFQAEARRCKEILDEVYKSPESRHFCIFDELYSGTNPYEAVASAYGYLNYLVMLNNCNYILTTHFINLCDLMEKKTDVLNKHMKVTINNNEDDQELEYTYKIVNGKSNIKGGTFVLKELNYPKEIIDDAVKILDDL